jgi:hypothetical protein
MRLVGALADQDGVPCYLETQVSSPPTTNMELNERGYPQTAGDCCDSLAEHSSFCLPSLTRPRPCPRLCSDPYRVFASQGARNVAVYKHFGYTQTWDTELVDEKVKEGSIVSTAMVRPAGGPQGESGGQGSGVQVVAPLLKS